MFLEILLSEIFGGHMKVTEKTIWDLTIDLPAWRRHEIRMFLISTVLVGLATLYFQGHPLDMTDGWRNLGMIFGGFGYCVIPLYLRRIIWGKTFFN